MTTLERKLAKTNLAGAADNRSLRRRQAAEYYRRLEPLGVIRGFDGESLPESHFPIRVAVDGTQRIFGDTWQVAASIRPPIFPFPRGLSRAHYPHAARAADEVILLPLGRVFAG